MTLLFSRGFKDYDRNQHLLIIGYSFEQISNLLEGEREKNDL